jgi:hypothetical protein
MRVRKHPLRCVSALHAGGEHQEHRQMWSYVQMGLPLLTIALTAAICFGVVSFVMGQPRLPY